MAENDLSLNGLGAVVITLLMTVIAGLILIGGYIYCLARHKSWRKSRLFYYMTVSLICFFECVLIVLVLYYKVQVAQWFGMAKEILLGHLDIIAIISVASYATLYSLRIVYDIATGVYRLVRK
jgi:hypothetical protein